MFTVTFHANGGTFNTNVHTPTMVRQIASGQFVGALPYPTRDNHRFVGWFTSAIGGTQIQSNTIIHGNVSFAARWEQLIVRVTFNANGGTPNSNRPVPGGWMIGNLPPAPTKNHHNFIGWFTAATGGTQISAATTVHFNTTFFAQWQAIPIKHPLRALTASEVNALRNNPRYVNEWDLEAGYIAKRGSILSYSGRFTSNPVRDVLINGVSRRIYLWIFIEEPGATGNIIGVPVIENMANNGGTNTGTLAGIIAVLGGMTQRRITTSVSIGIRNSAGGIVNVTNLRTVLVNSVQDAFAELALLVPDFRVSIAGAGSGRAITSNHPNGVAIDINYNTPAVRPRQNWDNHPRRLESGINSIAGFQYLNSLDVENVFRHHGWRLGYDGEGTGLPTDGFMHWNISRT